MPQNLKRYQQTRELHFITFSCFHRQPFLRTASARDLFLQVLERTRRRYKFVMAGYVVMPEHVHLLLSEPEKGKLSASIQMIKQESSRLWSLCERVKEPCSASKSNTAEIPHGLWQRRYYDFNVRTEKKRIEKLKYMHRNPVTRGLVPRPEDWLWSSYRCYALAEESPVKLNDWPKIALAAHA